MTSLFWEIFVVGLLLYGLSFLTTPLVLRGRQPVAVAPNTGKRREAEHPRMTSGRSRRMAIPNTGSSAATGRNRSRRVHGVPRHR